MLPSNRLRRDGERRIRMVGPVGLEPTTRGLKERSSGPPQTSSDSGSCAVSPMSRNQTVQSTLARVTIDVTSHGLGLDTPRPAASRASTRGGRTPATRPAGSSDTGWKPLLLALSGPGKVVAPCWEICCRLRAAALHRCGMRWERLRRWLAVAVEVLARAVSSLPNFQTHPEISSRTPGSRPNRSVVVAAVSRRLAGPCAGSAGPARLNRSGQPCGSRGQSGISMRRPDVVCRLAGKRQSKAATDRCAAAVIPLFAKPAAVCLVARLPCGGSGRANPSPVLRLHRAAGLMLRW